MFKAFLVILFFNPYILKTSNSYFKQSYFFYLILFIILLIGCNKEIKNEDKTITQKDSVEIWIEQSKSGKLRLDERRKTIEKAYKGANLIASDLLKLDYFSRIAYESEYLNNDALFREVNLKTLNLALKLKDTFKVADAHWNYGTYFSEKETIDSAYFHFHKAYDNFKSVKHEYYAAKMLYNLGFIQGRIKDYTGSEISLFKSIAIYKKLNKNISLYQSYNYLGLIYMELEEFDRAIFYHEKALDYFEKIEDKRTFKEGSLSNLGLVYQKQKDYEKAIESFEAALQNSNLKRQDINFYARLIDNIAYTNFLSRDTTSVFQELSYASNIRDSLNNISGLVISKRHLSEFYAYKLDTLKAVGLADEAYNLANQIDNNRDKLEALLLLSKVDKNKANKYLAEYVHLNDSLQIEERKTRNKFTRLRFETDEYIEETEKLSQQNILILLGSVFTLLLFSLAYFNRIQIAKNKELKLQSEQQKANEEILSLMLKQQSKLEEGRLKERHRISADLHDGVLGKIFGTRLGLGFLNLKGDESTLEKHKLYVDELQNIEKEIRTISHELKNEILSSKEDFSQIINDLIQQKSELGGFKSNFECNSEIDWDEVSDHIKINFYRIIQESLQNIIKYAKATKVKINIDFDQNILNLVVNDNGKGFDLSAKRKGIGLKNLESRTKSLKGKFRIDSSINKGTTIFVSCQMKN